MLRTAEEDTQYRVLVSMKPFPKTDESKPETFITVIAENQLTLSTEMGNTYQGAHISFIFQAFAIGEATFKAQLSDLSTKQQKAEIITRAIYDSQDYRFLNVQKS